jgi:hypothetical protein
MSVEVPREVDWVDWLRRWDAQQAGYVPEREARFTAMFDALAELAIGAALWVFLRAVTRGPLRVAAAVER